MTASGSPSFLGPALTMVALLMLGLGAVQVSAAGPGPGPTLGDTTIDLTRHGSVIVEGIPGTRGSLDVACADGTVVGGGFSHVSDGLHVIESRPDGIHAWRVAWVQSAADDSVLYVYAICLVPRE